jgi:hypothetical protein
MTVRTPAEPPPSNKGWLVAPMIVGGDAAGWEDIGSVLSLIQKLILWRSREWPAAARNKSTSHQPSYFP